MQTASTEPQIDRHELADLLCRALDKPGLKLSTWTSQQLHAGLEWDSAVFRFQGEAVDGEQTIPWSMILKVARPSEKLADPGGIRYWKREALAYQTGMLYQLPGGEFSAPSCYDVQEKADGSIWVWMEDVKDEVGTPWPLEQYALAARRLGRFNGGYLCGQSLPAEPWIPSNWLRQYVEHAAPSIDFMHKNPDHPILHGLFPGPALAQVLATWEERCPILDLLESLPQVFCHQDAFKRNLFAHPGQTIAIDWGYMGNAPVGAELVALIAGSMGFWEIPADKVLEFDQRCFEAYLQGLRDAGWSGDPKIVRTGYAVTLLLRYPIGATVGEMIPWLLDQESRARLEQSLDQHSEEVGKVDPAVVAYYQHVLPEAMKLLGFRRLLSLGSRMGIYSVRFRKR